MIARPRSFSVEFEGRTYNATYYHEVRTVTVIWEGSDLKRHEISSPTADAWSTARALLRKLLEAASMRGDLVRL